MIDPRRAYEIFAAALDRAGEDRDAFIAAACGDDAALRNEVNNLLRVALDESLPALLLSGEAVAEPPSQVGQQFGHFRLIERIGIGGMGIVYRAERIDGVPQSVAIKLLIGEMAGPDFERFQREAQILARLEHPAVARLVDTGTQNGRTWIAIEYVRGTRIDAYCDRRKVPIRQRVQLLIELTEAVAAAHRMLVVHRDIKPANVLVTEEGFPKLIDFGIGAVLPAADSAQLANPGRLFTPNYSSPEQVAGGPASVATDVFGLGALGYRLLCGIPPFPDATEPLRYMMAVAHDDPEAPTIAAARAGRDARLVRELRGDLDAILLKALARDPARRYATANDLAADLRRYLANEPVEAREPSLAYRVRKFAGRNRIPVAAALLLLGGALVAGVVYIRQARAVALARDMAAQRDHFLESLLTSANPSIGRRDVMVADLLDRVLAKSDEDISTDPLVAASILGVVGRTEKGLGRYHEAHLANDRQLALARRYPGDKTQLIDALNLESLVLYVEGRPADAEAPSREILQILDNRCDPQGVYADTVDILGEIEAIGQRDGEAEAAYQAELACARRYQGPKWSARTVHALNNLMMHYEYLGRRAQALATGEEALALAETAFAADAPYRLITELNYADTLAMYGHAVDAEPKIRSILARRLSVLGADHPETLMTGTSLAKDLLFQHRYAEAARTADDAASSLTRVVGPDHWLTANAWQALGRAQCHSGHPLEGMDNLQRAEAVYASRFTPSGWQTLQARAGIGSCLLAQHRYAEAAPLLQQAASGLESSGRNQYFATQAAYADLRDLYAATGNATAAAQWGSKVDASY